jgi:MFS transporter, PAT family, beta-lactamase induction signal transducer AmpG
MPRRHRVPVCLMGLTNLSYGLYGGVVAFAVPQLLGHRRVPEAAIAGLTAVAFSPGFWAFLLSPILDVRFSRRWYAATLAAVASLTLVVAFLNLEHLALLETVLTVGFFAAYLYQSAIGGWLSSITTAEEEKSVSVWMTIGNVGGFGVMAIGCNQLVRYLSPIAVALVLGVFILLPMIAFPFMQAPGPDRRLASESFPQFFGDLVSLVKRREVLVAVILFAAPSATFSLTNFLGGRGDDFHASPGFVGLVGGVGVAAGGIAGCLIFPALSRLMPLRPLYRGDCRRLVHTRTHPAAAHSGVFCHHFDHGEPLPVLGHYHQHRDRVRDHRPRQPAGLHHLLLHRLGLWRAHLVHALCRRLRLCPRRNQRQPGHRCHHRYRR